MSNFKFASRVFLAFVLFGGMSRAVTAATVLDIRSGSNVSLSSTSDSGAGFKVSNYSLSGYQTYTPFLSILRTASERGYNTPAAAGTTSPTSSPLDDIQNPAGGSPTTSLLKSSIPVVNLGGTNYYEFLLGSIEQLTNPNQRYISLNQVQLFQSVGDMGTAAHNSINNPTFTLTDASPTTNASIVFHTGSPTLLFTLSNASVSSASAFDIQIDDLRNVPPPNSPNGKTDMFFYVPTSVFSSDPTLTHITLFSQFGLPPGAFRSNDGVDQWAIAKAPVPSSLVMLATVGLPAFGYFALIRRRRSSATA